MNIQELLKNNPEDEKRIKTADRVLRLSKMFKDLEETDAVKELLKLLKFNIDDINNTLMNEYNLSETDRKVIIKQRECWEWLGELFNSQRDNIKRINNILKKYD